MFICAKDKEDMLMRIITQAIRVIDYENDKISARNIMPKFGEYICLFHWIKNGTYGEKK